MRGFWIYGTDCHGKRITRWASNAQQLWWALDYMLAKAKPRQTYVEATRGGGHYAVLLRF